MSGASDTWGAAYEPWAAAKREEEIYDRDVWQPAFDEHEAAMSDDINTEMGRLMDRRCKLEDAVFAHPALNACQLATKILIAFDNGRDADAYMPMILADCRRFADDTLTRGDLTEAASLASPWPAGSQRGLLAERNAAAAASNAARYEFDQNFNLARSLAAENMMMRMPAQTSDDVIARLVLIAQISPEGAEPDPEFCAAVIREAQAHFGMGALDATPTNDTEVTDA